MWPEYHSVYIMKAMIKETVERVNEVTVLSRSKENRVIISSSPNAVAITRSRPTNSFISKPNFAVHVIPIIPVQVKSLNKGRLVTEGNLQC